MLIHGRYQHSFFQRRSWFGVIVLEDSSHEGDELFSHLWFSVRSAMQRGETRERLCAVVR